MTILALAIAPTAPRTLYAGTLGGGVFKALAPENTVYLPMIVRPS